MGAKSSNYNVPAAQPELARSDEPVTSWALSGIWHFISATCCLILGIAAIPMLGYYSYFATPIWASVLLFGVTGVLAMYAHRNIQVRTAFSVMCVMSGAMSLSFVFMYSFAAAFEDYYACKPGRYWLYPCYYYSLEGRQAIDSLIVIFSAIELGTCIFGIYAVVAYNGLKKKTLPTVSGGSGPVMVQA